MEMFLYPFMTIASHLLTLPSGEMSPIISDWFVECDIEPDPFMWWNRRLENSELTGGAAVIVATQLLVELSRGVFMF